jgi:hypothetical protein
MRHMLGYRLPALVISCLFFSPMIGCSETIQTTLPTGLSKYPWSTDEKTSAWAEQLLGQVVTFKAMHDNGVLRGNFDPYVETMAKARDAYRVGDKQATYDTVNRFMVMLEARVGDIDPHAADTLWDACYRWTPNEYHARDRHARAIGHDKLDKVEEFIRHMEEKASLSF